MNIFASLIIVATLAISFSSQAQNRPAMDFNQAKKSLVEQQNRIVTMMESFKRCYATPPKEVATKTKCDANSQEFMRYVDQQISFGRSQVKCANSSTSVKEMQDCLKKEILVRPAPGTAGTATSPAGAARPTAPAQGSQPVKR